MKIFVGQIYIQPGSKVLIEVICKYPPDQSVEIYLKQIEKIVESAGIKYMYRVFAH